MLDQVKDDEDDDDDASGAAAAWLMNNGVMIWRPSIYRCRVDAVAATLLCTF